MKETILVTGGAGFIGSHTAVELLLNDYDVIIVDNLSNSEPFIPARINAITNKQVYFFKIDLCDLNRLGALFTKYKIHAVIHFAALKSVNESKQFPVKYFRNNLLSLLNILHLMEKHSVENIVFSSSATVYGQPDQLPVTEKDPFKKALSPYGATKQMGEEILEMTVATKNIKAISLRYFNPAGAHDSAMIGELPRGVPNNLVPFITQTGIGKRKTLTVFGNDYNTPDGTCIRDYIHVVDLAKAHVKSVQRLLQSKAVQGFEAFNIGTGIGVSVMEMITTFQEITGIDLRYTIGSRREGDVEKIYADVKLANEVLQWKSSLKLKHILQSAWDWESQLHKM